MGTPTTAPYIETTNHVLLVLRYEQECRTEQTPWEVTVQTHPRYTDPENLLDEPIRLYDGNKINVDMDVKEAEAVGLALLRAVQIRRELMAKYVDLDAPQPEGGVKS